jgi:hypothetical protein
MIGDPQGVGDDRQRRVDRRTGDEEPGVDDVGVVDVVQPAVTSRTDVAGSEPKRVVPF